MESGVVTASQFYEERTLTCTPFGSATLEEGASDSLRVSWLEESYGSAEVSEPATAAQSTLSDDADNPDSIPVPLIGVPALVSNQPNQ